MSISELPAADYNRTWHLGEYKDAFANPEKGM
jgi:hypothetical protein